MDTIMDIIDLKSIRITLFIILMMPYLYLIFIVFIFLIIFDNNLYFETSNWPLVLMAIFILVVLSNIFIVKIEKWHLRQLSSEDRDFWRIAFNKSLENPMIIIIYYIINILQYQSILNYIMNKLRKKRYVTATYLISLIAVMLPLLSILIYTIYPWNIFIIAIKVIILTMIILFILTDFIAMLIICFHRDTFSLRRYIRIYYEPIGTLLYLRACAKKIS